MLCMMFGNCGSQKLTKRVPYLFGGYFIVHVSYSAPMCGIYIESTSVGLIIRYRGARTVMAPSVLE